MAKKGIKESKKAFYTLEELSELLGIDERVLRRWCERGEIECVRQVGPNGVVYAVREEDAKKIIQKWWEKKVRVYNLRSAIAGLLYLVSIISLGYFGYKLFISPLISLISGKFPDPDFELRDLAGMFLTILFINFIQGFIDPDLNSDQENYEWLMFTSHDDIDTDDSTTSTFIKSLFDPLDPTDPTSPLFYDHRDYY